MDPPPIRPGGSEGKHIVRLLSQRLTSRLNSESINVFVVVETFVCVVIGVIPCNKLREYFHKKYLNTMVVKYHHIQLIKY